MMKPAALKSQLVGKDISFLSVGFLLQHKPSVNQ
jgi:hypothetical protein